MDDFLRSIRRILAGTDVGWKYETSQDGILVITLCSKSSNLKSDAIRPLADPEAAFLVVLEFLAHLRERDKDEQLQQKRQAMQIDQRISNIDNRLRDLTQAKAVSTNPPDGSSSWPDFIAKIDQQAKNAGGRADIYIRPDGVNVVKYYRLARLRQRTLFSPILLHEPFHRGQGHIFHFAMPADYDTLCTCLSHDSELYQKLV